MQSSRQKQIISLLMEHGTLTARQLAKRFSVSTRTIYRDIVTLTASGVPLSMTQGRDGGITLAPDYTPVKDASRKAKPQDPLSPDALGWITVTGSGLFAPLRDAIVQHHPIRFSYGEDTAPKAVEPLKLVNQHRVWYLFGYDLIMEEESYFRLSMMRELTVMPTYFDRTCPDTLPPIRFGAKLIDIKLLFNQDMAWRIYEDFVPDSIQSGSRLLVETRVPDNENLVSMILSYGEGCEVLEPESLRQKVRRALSRAQQQYFS